MPLCCSSASSASRTWCGRRGDDLGQLARAEADRVEPVQADERRRRVDRIHHVVERARERVDVLAIERRHERPVQPLDDPVGQEVALVLDLLDLVGLVPDRMRRREHLLEQSGAVLQLVGERLKVGEELLFARNQSEGQSGSSLQPNATNGGGAMLRTARPKPEDCSRSVYTAVTSPLHGRVYDVHQVCYGRQQRSPRAHPRRRSGQPAVSAHPAPVEAGRADRRPVPPDRHSDQQLPARGHPPHLRADAVQFGVAQPPHRPDLPDGSVQPRLRRDPGGRADARQPELVSGHGRRRPAGGRATSRRTTPTTT